MRRLTFDLERRRWRSSPAPDPASARAIARLFARQRARVVARLDLDEAAARRTAAAIGEAADSAAAIACDVADARPGRARLRPHRRRARTASTSWSTTPASRTSARSSDHDRADFDRLLRASTSRASSSAPGRAVPIMLRQGGGVILNMASIALAHRRPERFALLDDRRAPCTDDDDVDRRRLREAAASAATASARRASTRRSWTATSRSNYPGREAEMLAQLASYQPIGRMGTPEEVARLALYLCSDEAAFVTGQAYPIDGGVLGVMKLIRFGEPGGERPGAAARRRRARSTRPAFGARLRRGVLRRRRRRRALRAWLSRDAPRRAAGAGRAPGSGRRSRRPSKIVCIGLNFRDHAAESGMELPREPVIFFKATTSLVGPNDRARHPARRDEARLGSRAGGRHRRDARATSRADAGRRARRRLRAAQRLLGARVPARARRPVGEGQERRHVRAARPVPRDARRDARSAAASACGSTVNGAMRQQSTTAQHDLRRAGARQLREPVHDAAAGRRHQHRHAGRRRRSGMKPAPVVSRSRATSSRSASTGSGEARQRGGRVRHDVNMS